MNYTIRNTEQNNKKANEFETKSLLYLIGMRNDSHEVDVLTIDCFNDVTGINDNLDKLWDIQAKNYKKLSPKQIGEFLFTLFDNYISGIDFYEYIFFIPKLEDRYKNTPSDRIYYFKDIKKETQCRIRNGLNDEILRVKKSLDESIVDKFLEVVLFVEDRKEISTYIKKLTKFKSPKIAKNEFYESIFEEIRDKQSAKKNSEAEGVTLSCVKDVLCLERHLYTKDIRTLIVSRFIGGDIFQFSNKEKPINAPISFLPELSNIIHDSEAIQDTILDINSNLCKAFFNKNSNREFWKIIEHLFKKFSEKPNEDITTALLDLSLNVNIKSPYLTQQTLKFLISVIKDGIEHED